MYYKTHNTFLYLVYVVDFQINFIILGINIKISIIHKINYNILNKKVNIFVVFIVILC